MALLEPRDSLDPVRDADASDPTLAGRLAYYARSLPTLAFGVRRPLSTAWSLAVLRQPTDVALRCGLAFRCRDPTDLWIVKETCLDRDYEPDGSGVRPGDRVLDLGAGIGDFAVRAAVLGRARCVVACEPDPASHALLCANVRANGASAVLPLAVAAGAREGAAELPPSRHPVRNATRAPSGRGTLVPVATLRQLVERLPESGCDFLKIDIEGGEYDLLDACDDTTLASIPRVAAELHPVSPGRRRALLARLAAAGFEWRFSPCPVNRGQGVLHARRPVSAGAVAKPG